MPNFLLAKSFAIEVDYFSFRIPQRSTELAKHSLANPAGCIARKDRVVYSDGKEWQSLVKRNNPEF